MAFKAGDRVRFKRKAAGWLSGHDLIVRVPTVDPDSDPRPNRVFFEISGDIQHDTWADARDLELDPTPRPQLVGAAFGLIAMDDLTERGDPPPDPRGDPLWGTF